MREEKILDKYIELKSAHKIVSKETSCCGTACYVPPTCGDSCDDGGGGE